MCKQLRSKQELSCLSIIIIEPTIMNINIIIMSNTIIYAYTYNLVFFLCITILTIVIWANDLMMIGPEWEYVMKCVAQQQQQQQQLQQVELMFLAATGAHTHKHIL